MNTEHPTDIPTAPQQQQPTSLFSDVVTVISGARQSANQEFNKFWDKYISKRITDNGTSSSQYLPIHFTEYDLACIKEGKNIQGRLIPVSNRGQEEVSPTDKDIVRSSEKRKTPPTEDDSTSNILPYTKASKRLVQSSSSQEASYISPSNFLIPSPRPIFSNSQPMSSTPEKVTSVSSQSPQLSPITSSPYQPTSRVNTTQISVSPIQSPARNNTIRTSLTPTQSPVRQTAIQSSVSSIKHSPERSKNPIITGSSKSVQRLASEIAIKLSPGGLSPFSPKKEYTATTVNDTDPFQSTPLVKTSTDISARKTAIPKTRRFIIEEEDERITRIQNKLIKQANEHIISSQDKAVEEDKEDERVNHVQKTTISEDEVDQRLNNLQNRINVIQSAVAEFISSPVEIISPKPIHTPYNKKIAALEAQVDPSIAINKPATCIDISDDDNTSLFDVNDIPSPPLPSYFALNHAPSPPPRPETIVSSPKKSFSASPLRPLSADPFNRDNILRKHSVVTENITHRFSPYSRAQHHVKTARRHSVINKDNTSHGNSSPNKTEPTSIHKLKMRSLVNAIPFCKLRKADTITGSDGITRPNPFWKEIYGGRK
ncbi:hypothetical protein BDF21DRAFT_494973 [Thamnidium elegans]|uniref:Uncharacterized protein n=1 Tax=Thamnidium elegans TaxID=101142 RepID=A0A8H7SKG4_9FUNG|nr:hypothetical protein INT48_005361 [Thamnidium elegans]KAI8076241.1 hypothetical protein BDF21DRAFT_494973 [Thamnidium elegans]